MHDKCTIKRTYTYMYNENVKSQQSPIRGVSRVTKRMLINVTYKRQKCRHTAHTPYNRVAHARWLWYRPRAFYLYGQLIREMRSTRWRVRDFSAPPVCENNGLAHTAIFPRIRTLPICTGTHASPHIYILYTPELSSHSAQRERDR